MDTKTIKSSPGIGIFFSCFAYFLDNTFVGIKIARHESATTTEFLSLNLILYDINYLPLITGSNVGGADMNTELVPVVKETKRTSF